MRQPRPSSLPWRHRLCQWPQQARLRYRSWLPRYLRQIKPDNRCNSQAYSCYLRQSRPSLLPWWHHLCQRPKKARLWYKSRLPRNLRHARRSVLWWYCRFSVSSEPGTSLHRWPQRRLCSTHGIWLWRYLRLPRWTLICFTYFLSRSWHTLHLTLYFIWTQKKQQKALLGLLQEQRVFGGILSVWYFSVGGWDSDS